MLATQNSPIEVNHITTLSPIDGRYRSKTNELSLLMSEFGLIKARLIVEIEWLIHIAKQPDIKEIPQPNEKQVKQLRDLYTNFNLKDAANIKEIEQVTNHDVKAVEYFIKQTLESYGGFDNYLSFIHFACTSEDINNLAYGIMLKQSRASVMKPALNAILDKLINMGTSYKNNAMLSRTHGQSATPTTMGKEIINYADRLKKSFNKFNLTAITGKLNGAVGNYNAHFVAYPNVNWPLLTKQFVENLELEFNSYTTQINPHDDIAELSHCLIRINNILIDLCRDIWGYISLNYFKQKVKPQEVGSSTMPHKVNPIDFENAEGNLGLANSMLDYFANKLPISRWQRDLSDSTVLRNLSMAFGYSLLAYKNIQTGLNKLILNEDLLTEELNQHWELLAEPVQTVMRKYGIKDAYEQLKDLTRGEKLNQNLLQEFIVSQPLPKDVKANLLKLTPLDYTGLAAKLTEDWK